MEIEEGVFILNKETTITHNLQSMKKYCKLIETIKAGNSF